MKVMKGLVLRERVRELQERRIGFFYHEQISNFTFIFFTNKLCRLLYYLSVHKNTWCREGDKKKKDYIGRPIGEALLK